MLAYIPYMDPMGNGNFTVYHSHVSIPGNVLDSARFHRKGLHARDHSGASENLAKHPKITWNTYHFKGKDSLKMFLRSPSLIAHLVTSR